MNVLKTAADFDRALHNAVTLNDTTEIDQFITSITTELNRSDIVLRFVAGDDPANSESNMDLSPTYISAARVANPEEELLTIILPTAHEDYKCDTIDIVGTDLCVSRCKAYIKINDTTIQEVARVIAQTIKRRSPLLKLADADRSIIEMYSAGLISMTELVLDLVSRGIGIRQITTGTTDDPAIEVIVRHGKLYLDLTHDAGQVDEHNWPVLQSVVVLI
ncbi:hypothetical protein HOS33_gp253 [Erwinia phage vB_EamM_Y3]|uniref:Uncharacterized protein n=1 Tax=Erwinia phage vB_EamM_Y3 TaxID=1983553 RepID=A0A2H4IBG4_9CAUD|nr:hypothetical protein HOS33_gp253 [Erwinia phage vB_EamM_Y3]ARW58893.1 hypothetical protein Y3_253 [Erwinia phage vB_EamM_Y3]